MCARCRRRVERVTSWRDLERAEFHFVFHCHGAKQEVTLSDEVVNDYGTRITMGDAFAESKLPALEG